MSQEDIFRDPRTRSVAWRDLVPVRHAGIVAELLLPAGWLAASLVAAEFRWYVPAPGLSFVFFLAGLRVVHNAFHCAPGLPRWANDGVLWVMSVVMPGSLHAVRFNHLRHHRPPPGEEDVEGRSAEMVWWRALLFGPEFTRLLHATALRKGPAELRAVVAGELILSAAWIAFVFGVSGSRVL